MNYTINDNLPAIRVGDTLTLEDGSVHEAVSDSIEFSDDCDFCSLSGENCHKHVNIECGSRFFHFKRIK